MIAALALLLAPALAQQELPVFSAEPIRATLWGTRGLYVEPARVDGDVGGAARAELSWAHRPLVAVYDDGTEQAILAELIALHVGAGLRLGPVRVSAGAPWFLRATRENLPDAHPLLGDPEIGAIWEALSLPLAGRAGALAISPLGRLRVPLGASAWQLGQPGWSWALGAAADLDLEPLSVGVNLGTRGVPGAPVGDLEVDDQLWFRLGAGYALSADAGASLEMAGHTQYRGFGVGEASPVELTAGGWWRQLRGGLGVGVSPGVGNPVWRVTIGAGELVAVE